MSLNSEVLNLAASRNCAPHEATYVLAMCVKSGVDKRQVEKKSLGIQGEPTGNERGRAVIIRTTDFNTQEFRTWTRNAFACSA